MRCSLLGGRGNGNTWITPILVHLVVAALLSNWANAQLQLSEEDGSNSREEFNAVDGHERFRRSILMPLGKRITSSLVAELGRRPRQLYSFGIGKRSISQEDMAEFLAEEAEKEGKKGSKEAHKGSRLTGLSDSISHPEALQMMGMEKRNIYPLHDLGDDFGLGQKRDPYAFGFGKRGSAYSFGLGKRDPYSFGLGKRDPYSFGLGRKRDPYSFGLGKRDPYSFGLGKRDPYSFGLGKRDPYSFGLGKRQPYSFGLGKRSSNSYVSESRDN